MFDCEDFSEGEQQKKLFRNMLNIGIPANAHNGVVAGENAKVARNDPDYNMHFIGCLRF